MEEEIKDSDVFKLMGKMVDDISMFESKYQEKPTIIVVSYKLQNLLMCALEIASYTTFGEHKIISLFYGIGLMPSKKLNDLLKDDKEYSNDLSLAYEIDEIHTRNGSCKQYRPAVHRRIQPDRSARQQYWVNSAAHKLSAANH